VLGLANSRTQPSWVLLLGVNLGVAAKSHLIKMGVSMQADPISLGLAAKPHPTLMDHDGGMTQL